VTSVKAGQESARLHGFLHEHLHANVEKQYGVDYVRFEAEYKRFLVSPREVRLIDSVYRNRDAGAARRGLKRLNKWWAEGDATLKQVQDGTFE
jgi:NLR family CARD domain-containing protein 3